MAPEVADGPRLKKISSLFNVDQWKTLNEEMSFSEYLEKVYENPKLIRNAHQRAYDMIIEPGVTKFTRYRKTYYHYNFFDNSEIPIFGLEPTLHNLVMVFKGAAGGYGTDRRIVLLHGPVGSSKSTICRRLKRGYEDYTATEAGAWYTYKWVNLPTGDNGIYTNSEDLSPMHEEPLKLIPIEIRNTVLKQLNEKLFEMTPEKDRPQQYQLKCEGELNPRCRKFLNELLAINGGDWGEVMKKHIRVVRKVASEADRLAIATFQPKDEKNQDATELTGDVNYAKLPMYGSDSDARAFNFDGELCVGNRGIVEIIEILKLDKEFLYDFLGATQEKQIKPKKFSQIPVDLILIGHTNNPEYERVVNDRTQEAFRDRTVKIDVPYQLEWSKELAILRHDYGTAKVKQHVAPHTLEIAALWAVLTRLEDDKDHNLSLIDKAKLYDGRSMPNHTEDSVKEMRDKHPEEGMKFGVSCRYVQDKISNCLSSNYDYINAFMVLNELREGLNDSALITNKDDIERYSNCIDLAAKELDEILKNEVQRALVGDEDAIIRLCANYIDNLMAYINKHKIRNQVTGKDQEPNERLMRSIEEKIEIPSTKCDDFRRQIASFIGHLAHKEEKFRWDSNPQLKKALEAKLFEDTRDHIKLSALNQTGSAVVAKDVQDKIDAIRARLIKQYGYNEQSARDVLDHVGSIFARGDVIVSD